MKKRLWGQHLWARGYFCASSGTVTDEVIKEYIEHQDKPADDGFNITEDAQGFSRLQPHSHRLQPEPATSVAIRTYRLQPVEDSVVTGPRQVGKSTLLMECGRDGRAYVTLDDMELRTLARSDLVLFFQTHKPPILIDEVQYAPELFPVIKMIVDRDKRPGQFWLTGSQKFHLMKGITESLAGRVAILDLLGFSEKEKAGLADAQKPFLPSAEWVEAAAPSAVDFTVGELYRGMWQGSFPLLCTTPGMSRDIFYNSYLQPYIRWNVKNLLKGGNRAF